MYFNDMVKSLVCWIGVVALSCYAFSPQESKSEVSVRDGTVTEDGTSESSEHDRRGAKRIDTVANGIEIESVTFRPPNMWKFKRFPNSVHWVDTIPPSFDELPPTIDAESNDAIRLLWLVTSIGDTADGWQLVAEGLLQPPPGTGPVEPHYWSAQVIPNKVISVDLYKPETSTGQEWQDTNFKMSWDEVYFRTEKVKIRIILDQQIGSVDEYPFPIEIRISRFETTKGNWAEININEDDELSPDGKEVWMSLTRAEIVALGLLPTEQEDGVDEFSSADRVSPNTTGSNHNDGDSFDVRNQIRGWKANGMARDNGNENANPPVPAVLKDFVVSGGAQLIEARSEGVQSKHRMIKDQADWFYYSGHGSHATGELLSASVTAADVLNEWGDDMEKAFIAGCSVLDINDYNNNYQGADHTKSPGEDWANSGADVLYGYNFGAPLDDNLGNPDYTKDIINGYFNSFHTNDALKWLVSNKDMSSTTNRNNPGGRVWNSCVIDMSQTPQPLYVYWDFNALVDGQPTVASIPKNLW